MSTDDDRPLGRVALGDLDLQPVEGVIVQL
jgi:hypothetical protein